MPRARRELVPIVSRLSPRHALSAPEAALFVGISATMFRELVGEGLMPRPREIRARVLWDVDKLVLAFRAFPRQGEAKPTPALKDWDAVVNR